MSNLKTLRHCNDRVGARGRLHKNLIVVPGEGIVKFAGESIPPRCTIVSVGYKKDGKWSHTSWTLELAPDTYLVVFDQNWETGKWFNAKTWSGAIDSLMGKIEHVLSTASDDGVQYTLPTRESVKQCIREVFPDYAKEFDNQENNKSSVDQFAALLEAQRQFALAQEEAASVIQEIRDLEEVERLQLEAAKLRASASKARTILQNKGKINISELKALMNME